MLSHKATRTGRLAGVRRWWLSWLIGGGLMSGCVPGPDVWTAEGVDLWTGAHRTVDGWYRFTEGPTRDPKGGVYFSDLVSKKIYRWDPSGAVKTLREGEATNGLYVSSDGTLYGCEPYARRVVRIDAKGASHSVAERYQGHRFNSCNDLWVDPKGGIYFTDPLYSKDRAKDQDGEHVYYVPASGQVRQVTKDLVRPNGIIGTPDGSHVFVVDDGVGKTYRYRVEASGDLAEKTLFTAHGADGLALDAQGRLYMVGETVMVFNEAGSKVADFDFPFRPTNVAFGGKDRRLLFVTGKWVVHILTMKVRGAGP